MTLRSTASRMIILFTAAICVQVAVSFVPAQAQSPTPPTQDQLEPLAAKEQMIRDRFQRFSDRIYALSEELSEVEPDNAARLARALERAGELGLSDQLEQIMKLLNEPGTLHNAVEAQSEWLTNAERVLSILLERDSDNEERRSEIERLEAYRKQIGELLEQQRALREESANATSAARMKEQLEQAMKRLEAIMAAQARVAEQGKNAASDEERKDAAAEQERLSRQTDELSEDLKRLSQPPEQANEPSAMQQAREQTKSAGESAKSASKSQSQAGQNMQQQGAQEQAQQEQKDAKESLEKAKEQLEAAQKSLGQEPSAKEQSPKQQGLAEKTKQLGDQMQQDQQEGSPGSKGKSGGKQGQQSAQKSVQQAEKEMKDASESLDEEKPDEATPKQDKAIEELEEAKRELEEQLQQLRKEEREETLRDLEARFRDMLARQRPINDATVELDATGVDNFTRADELRLADLADQELKLAGEAAAALHILDEEGTTIAFPHVVGQIAEDMKTVADRLADSKVEAITQAIEREIVEALEQLLDAVKKMQQENEQNSQQASAQSGEPPLLPKSAELKLLRASQERVNTRTQTIESSVEQGEESPDAASSSLKKLAGRQVECMGIAKQMRDSKP